MELTGKFILFDEEIVDGKLRVNCTIKGFSLLEVIGILDLNHRYFIIDGLEAITIKEGPTE